MISARKRSAFAWAIIAGLTLSGCAVTASEEVPEAAAPSVEPTEETTEESTGTASGDVAAPGSTVKLGEWASYDYAGIDDATAVIAARLVSIEPATAAQTDYLVKQISQLKGYNVWFLSVEQQKVSGDSIAFDADYTGFSPVDANSEKIQDVTVIGWDDCTTQSFTKEFDTDGATIEQCFIAATVEGGNDVAGVIYAEYDSVYAYYDGKPLSFLK
ncbi:hypothetical protein I6E81_02290 [Salinibacterium sp. NG22]|uniref:hypothetical protein n=1 Tax=Salinibacterium sp. NG22 TaxID=2792040 RepID=UPI0018CD4FCA|nr:hypothetical protein [Salinibacterium sp. NG22]MBH0108992.1 hypothetical protein [Salinibacterium sp. NG22]